MLIRVIEAVIFDLDGTLHDRDASVIRALHRLHAGCNGALAHVPLDEFCGVFVELDGHGYTPKERLFADLVDRLSIRSLPAEDLQQRFFNLYESDPVPFAGLRSVLGELRRDGLRLAMITNGRSARQARKLELLGIRDAFEHVLVSESEGVKKPDRAIFDRCVMRLGVGSDRAVYVGDSPRHDIDGARDAGLRAVWKRTPYWKAPAAADGVVDDLSELSGLLRRWRA